ncbi:hypothetical protein JQX09_17695 [Sulfitobacter pseudonitzschiae]|uniref:Uncharacterized protein n=1 Tax=Pseudosulfitobacter pseudonitzschiae TaxID=1402135 RepID=A0A9Q2S1N4_9RHOB|nr:hypothetical protein [Pseudosulfitobacter pseudonitzschiae]MBM2293766.1 hypothetical protein [Pseudosulfitobacter pseudonitzschiae]MBM2298684.1 hypothetical protein [Pseudosulfitobacter pseudonitzschiae]MBM2303598.1 hypothetical protein [Pseudosulfitobacter pseudonitzschiae]MBM2313381.1 hypothetical protein [Pseudosulfitobacter pseudonitzschiae]MBM2318294.1 hypothetical protein [Pseudosulfitobacter pseudonitzschiae]
MATRADPNITKSDKVRQLLADGQDLDALRIAKDFRFLKDVKQVIQRGWSAHQNPSFTRQLGRDPDETLNAAIAALRTLYG